MGVCLFVCVTPETSTERRMSHAERGAAGAVQEPVAGGGQGVGTTLALVTNFATAVAASGGNPIGTLAVAITYVLW
jgi:hypothetical protein